MDLIVYPEDFGNGADLNNPTVGMLQFERGRAAKMAKRIFLLKDDEVIPVKGMISKKDMNIFNQNYKKITRKRGKYGY
jgi:hypothetical protein